MKSCVVDVETNGLINPSILHVISVLDCQTEKVHSFYGDTLNDAQAFIASFDSVIGHNFIHFDHPNLQRLANVVIPRAAVIDTLVLSQLLDAKREGGHSLEAWGERLGHPKIEHNEWHTFSKEMLRRCEEDTRLNYKVYLHLMKIIDRNKVVFDKAIDIEMKARWSALDTHTSGFRFDINAARILKEELEVKLAHLQKEMRKVFPAKAKLLRVVTPKLTKDNTISKVGISSWYGSDDYTRFSADASFSLVEWLEFEPSSPKQIVDRLDEAGWKPIEKTKGHIEAIKSKNKETIAKFKKYGYKVNEVNIATLPEHAPDACQLIIEHVLLDARRRTLNEWIEAYNEKTGRVHGSFNPLGTRSHRCSHSRPNMGNVATAKTIKYNTPKLQELAISLGGLMRSMWVCDDDSFLVGCDMDGVCFKSCKAWISSYKSIECFLRKLPRASKDFANFWS